MKITIIHRSRCEPGSYVVVYDLSNGWRIQSAQLSRERQGKPRFSIYDPGLDPYHGPIGGADTLRACMVEVQRLADEQAEAGLAETQHQRELFVRKP